MLTFVLALFALIIAIMNGAGTLTRPATTGKSGIPARAESGPTAESPPLPPKTGSGNNAG